MATFDVAWYTGVVLRALMAESAKTMARVATIHHFRFSKIRQ